MATTLFGKVKSLKDRKMYQDLFKFIVEATNTPAGYATAPASHVREIAAQYPDYLLVSGDPDPGGNVRVSATPAGIAALGGVAAAAPVETAASMFTIDDGFIVPPSARGVARTETYPFTPMQVGQSFFVPATEAKPNPAKSLNSTINSTNRRFSDVFPAKKGKNPHPQAGQPTGIAKRKYVVRPVKAGALSNPNDPNSKRETANGARVYRVL